MDFIIYAVCFGVGLVFTILSAALGHLFGGHDAHSDVGTGGQADAGFEHTGMPGIAPFSPTTIASFLTAAGGFGMIFSRMPSTRSVYVSAPLSILGGLIVSAGVFLLFSSIFRKTQSSSESHVGALIGHIASIITPIPVDGVGEIVYVHSGTRYTAPARTEGGHQVKNGQDVRIVRIVGSQFYVEPCQVVTHESTK